MAESLRVPDEAIENLKRLAAMDDAQFKRLLELIAKLPAGRVVTITPYRAMDGQLPEDQDLFFATISNVGQLARSAAMSRLTPEAAAALVQERAFPQGDALAGALSGRLVELLAHKSLALHARAWDLMFENERVTTGLRIITDIRPIFDPSVQSEQGIVIINHLHVTYIEDDEKRNIFFSLDEDDIERLDLVVKRAKEKIAHLKRET
jgi:hypothetical protein